MVQFTMQLSDPLAKQVLPARRWLPAVLELSLARLKTPAAEMSSEIIDFLLRNPTLDEVMTYHASVIGRNAGCKGCLRSMRQVC